MILEEEEEEDIGTLEESSISFRLSGPNEELSQNDQVNEESVSSIDSAVHSPRKEPRNSIQAKRRGR